MAGGALTGRRQPDGSHSPFDSQPGDYWREDDGTWQAITPNGLYGNLGNHDITEHDDGTITVSPSILVTGEGEWHGFLEHGEWRQV